MVLLFQGPALQANRKCLPDIGTLVDVLDGASRLHVENVNTYDHADEDEPDLTGWPEKVSPLDICGAIPWKEFADSLVAVCFINTNTEASLFTHYFVALPKC